MTNIVGNLFSETASVTQKKQIYSNDLGNTWAIINQLIDIANAGGGNSFQTSITTANFFSGINTPGFNNGIYLVTDAIGIEGGLLVRVFSDINGVQFVDVNASALYANPDYQKNGTYDDASIFALTGTHWSGNAAIIWQTNGISGNLSYFPKVRFNITNTSADFTLNGGFAVDASGWTLGANSAYDAIKPGVLFTNGSTIGQNAPISNGGTYTVTFTVYSYVSGGVTPVLGGTVGTTVNAAGTYKQTFVAGFAPTLELSFNIANGSALGITGITCTAVIAVNDLGNTPGSTFKVLATDNTTYMDVMITGGDCNPDATLLDDTSGATANITGQVANTFGIGDSLDNLTSGGTAIILLDSPSGTSGKSPGTLTINKINLTFSGNDQLEDANGHIAFQNGNLIYNFNVNIGDIVIADNNSGVGQEGIFHYEKITTTVSSQDPSTDAINFKVLTSDGTTDGKKLLSFGYIEVCDSVVLVVNRTLFKVINRFSVSDSFGNIYNNKVNVINVTNFPFGNANVAGNDLLQDTGTAFGNYLGAFTGNTSLSGSFGTIADTASITNQVVESLLAFDDDAAAGLGGLTAGMVFQTTGGGAITTPGVVCIKQ